MKWALGIGLSIAALGFTVDARADDQGPPPPVVTHSDPPPPPPPAGEPPPAPHGVPAHPHQHHPVDESSFVELRLESDSPGTYLQALTEHEGWIALQGRWRTRMVYGRNLRWQPVCEAPCTMRVPPQLVYRVAGPSVTPSDDFTLGPPGGSQTLHVDAGSRAAHTGGAISVIVGVPTAIVGLILIGAGHNGTRDAGFITGGIGIGLIGLGAVLLATSTTNVIDDHNRMIGRLKDGLSF